MNNIGMIGLLRHELLDRAESLGWPQLPVYQIAPTEASWRSWVFANHINEIDLREMRRRLDRRAGVTRETGGIRVSRDRLRETLIAHPFGGLRPDRANPFYARFLRRPERRLRRKLGHRRRSGRRA